MEGVAVDSLPKDVLLLILRAAVRDDPESAWRVAQVCTRWRDAMRAMSEWRALVFVWLKRERLLSPAGAEVLAREIVLLGAIGAGKMSLMMRLTKGYWVGHKYEPNQMCFLPTNAVAMGEYDAYRVVVEMMRLPVEMGSNEARLASFSGASVLVFPVNDRSMFDRMKVWAEPFRHKTTVMLVGTKCDVERAVSIEEAHQLAAHLGCGYAECSALTGEGVHHVFATAAKLGWRHVQVGNQTEQKCVLQ